MIGRGGAPHAKNAIALPGALGNANLDRSVPCQSRILDRLSEMAAVRPKLKDVALDKRALRDDLCNIIANRRHAANENATVVRATIAHDLVSAVTSHVSRGETP